MHISIIGSPGCGKTTLFRAFTGIAASDSTQASNVAVVEVPDERLDKLSAIFNPRKTVYGRIEVYDMPSIHEGDMKNDAIPAKQLQQMRLSDAFLLVLKQFGEPTGDVLAGFHTVFSEFIISDMVQVETRLERIKKQNRKGEGTSLDQEAAALEQCLAHLEQGKPLSTLPLFQTDGRNLRGFQFLSQKPLMVVVNCSEEQMAQAGPVTDKVKAQVPEGVPVVAACLRLEAELAAMEPEDQAAFMAEYGVTESLRGRFIRLAYQTLGLISFLTVGEDECRAWPIRDGISAQEAAGTIHTDLSDRFIRSETVSYEDFIRYGDMAACKKAGVWRLEGKQYTVRDGDILCIRAGGGRS